MSEVLAHHTLLAALPPLSPRLAAARDRILSIFSRTIGGLVLKPAIADDAPQGPWVVFDTAVGRVGLAQIGDDAASHDHAAVLARLDQLEPLLAALEGDGLSLDPVDVAAVSEEDIHVRIEAFDSDQVLRHVAVLAFSIPIAEAWPEPGEVAADISSLVLPLPVVLTLDGPTVRADAALGRGDVVLLPFGVERVLPAALTVAGHQARGFFSPARGGFSINNLVQIPMTDFAVSAAIEPSSPDPAMVTTDLPVTLRVALGEVTLTAGQLANLRPGASVTLDVPPGEARAVLLAGERPVASGRLVALGEAYGLIIDKIGVEA